MSVAVIVVTTMMNGKRDVKAVEIEPVGLIWEALLL